ncbi:MAG: hypothetical protein ACLUI3_02910 [Christensenellales bacterium]
MTSSETDGIRDIYNDLVCGVDNGGTFNMYGGCYLSKRTTHIPRIARLSATSATPSTARCN